MKTVRLASILILTAIIATALLANFIAPASYAHQFRDLPDAAPSSQHLLGTDELGRDRLARLIYGTRVSLILAPMAALLSAILAGLIGGTAGFFGGWYKSCVMGATDLFLSLPWLFLLITVRALLPLNVSPLVSVLVTFLMLGLLGWTSSARVLCSSASSLRESDFVRQARASGVRGARLFWIHVLPNLKPVLLAQFWISIPVFILTEANLGILGLGVAEPMPSWGSLLRELEGLVSVGEEPWKFVPLILLVVVVTSFQLVLSKQDELSA